MTVTTGAELHESFASSPLITPERLTQDPAEALGCTPPWTLVCGLAGPETLPAEAVAVVRVGDKHPDQYFMPAVSLAIIFELTRFGNSVTTNTNKKAGSEVALYYLKITFRGASEDNMPVSRIITGAGPRQAVLAPPELPHNLHPDGLTIQGAGKPTKEARATAMRHADRCAKDYGCTDAEVASYRANLRELFSFHDELFGIVSL
jgi:hypothetical protein